MRAYLEDIYQRVRQGTLTAEAALLLVRQEEIRRACRVRVGQAGDETEPLVYYHPVWETAGGTPAPATPPLGECEVVVFGRYDGLYRLIQQACQVPRNGHLPCTLVVAEGASAGPVEGVVGVRPGALEDFIQLLQPYSGESDKPLLLLHAWNFELAGPTPSPDPFAAVQAAFRNGYETVFHIVKALGKLKFRRPVRLLYLHRNDEGRARPEDAALAGLLLTAQLENKRVLGKLVGVEGNVDPAGLHAILQSEWACPPTGPDAEVRYIGDRREIRRFAEATAGARTEGPPLRTNGTYVVTGALGGLGRIFLRELAARRANLILIGRAAASSRHSDLLRELADRGARVSCRPADVARFDELAACVQAARREFGAIHGVIHGAGVIEDSLIASKTAESTARVLAPKVAGTVALDLVTEGDALDFFVLFSSLAAVRGNLGQSDYAAGNRFMDQFADWREAQRQRGRRSGRSLAINWPLWRHGGMQVSPQVEEAMLRGWGMKPLETADGIAAFHHALALPYAQVGVLVGEASRLRASGLLSACRPATAERPPAPPLMPEAGSGRDPEGSARQVGVIVAGVLKVDPRELNLDTDLHEYGVDSILLTEIALKLEKHFGVELDPNDVIEHPTLRAVGRFLAWRAAPPAREPAAAARMDSLASPAAERIETTRRDSAAVPSAPAPAATSHPIAVIALACRFPGATSPEEFWENLRAGRCAIGEVPADRMPMERYFDPDPAASRKSYSKWGGFISGVEDFDAAYFSIGETEATGMDPQHRIALELTQELFDRAGYRREDVRRTRTGVFLGGGKSAYAGGDSWAVPDSFVSHVVLNTIPNMMAGRVANFFDLRGSAEVLDTACSSSLVAIHRACRSLATGETEMAIAGGISLILDPFGFIGFAKAGALARTPIPYIFDERANGFCMAEGAGLVLLKPLERALADGDQVAAVILGTGTNNDGHTMGWTTPNMEAQRLLLDETYKRCRISPAEIGYLEAHGTGTLLGDPIEVRAATQIFAQYTLRKQFCGLGSVKSNVGHTFHAAGVCGFIKTVLALQHREIPPTLHCERPHPRFKFHESSFFLPHAVTPFPKLGDHCCAAVSAFGFGGTNAHVVVREQPATTPSRRRPLPLTRFQRKRYWLDKIFDGIAAVTPAAAPDLRPTVGPKPGAPGRPTDPQAHVAGAGALAPKIERYLVSELSALLQVPAEAIDPEASFDELGLDSTSLVETAQRLEHGFQVELYPTLLFEHPTVRRLAAHFAEAEPAAFERVLANPAARVAAEPKAAAPTAAASAPAPAVSTPAPDLAGQIEGFLCGRLGGLLAVASAEISVDANFMEMGLDSVGLVELAQELEREVGIELYPTLFFEHQNIRDISKYFCAEHGDRFVAFLARLSGPRGEPIVAKAPPSRGPAPVPAAMPSPRTPALEARPETAPVSRLPEPVFPRPRAAPGEPERAVAIIGMAGRFPESDSPDEFWHHLRSGRDLMREVPPERWDYRPHFDSRPQAPNRLYCKWGSFIPRVKEFDAPLFGIGDREARSLDPQLRLFLEVVHAAADDAGYGAKLAGSRTGVYVGSCYQDYVSALQHSKKTVEPYDLIGNARTMLANRISYCWDLRGPSLVLDTACSSSLVAVHLACQALRNGECDTAIAGGINVILSPERYVYFCSLSALSPTGRCHSFDSRADGYVPGEAVACVMLKPLDQALRDGDPIHAVIRGSAIAHGGHANTVTAPNPRLESEVITRAWKDARVDPATVSYIEAHGTGTKLGDPVEVQGLCLAFEPFISRKQVCALGTAKAHMGHAEGAAGLVGLIKTVLSMEHGVIPAMPSLGEINPLIRLEDSPFYINRAPVEWTVPDGGPRRAGISSFGFGGSYAHLVVESFADPAPPKHAPAVPPPELFVWSAVNRGSLHRHLAAMREWLRTPAGAMADLGDVAHTLRTGRKAYPERAAIIADTPAQLGQRIDDFLRTGAPTAASAPAIMFQGSAGRSGTSAFEPPPGAARPLEHWARQWVAGQLSDWSELTGTADQRRRLFLPLYAYSRQVYWFEEEARPTGEAPAVPGLTPEGPAVPPAVAPAPEKSGAPAVSTDLARIQSHVRENVAALLRLEAAQVDLDASVDSLGLDSIMGMQLGRSVQERFGLALFASEALAQPTLRALCAHINAQLSKPSATAAPPSAVSPPLEATLVSPPAAAARVNSRPILFLLSSPRCGSTLLRVMLAGHSRLFCPPELHLLAFATMGERGKFFSGRRKFLNEGLVRALMELKRVGPVEAAAIVEGWEASDCPTADVFAALQDLAGERILVDKSPSYGDRLDILQRARELFPAARYLHLVRHPCAMMESYVRNRFDQLLGLEGDSPWRNAEDTWTRINCNIVELGKQVAPERWRTLRYEDLVAATDQEARELCRFLEVPFEPSLLSPYQGERMTDGLHSVSLGIGDPNFLSHDRIDPELSDAWRERMPPGLRLGELTLATAATLGYWLGSDGRELPLHSPAQALLLQQAGPHPVWHIVHRLRFQAAVPLDPRQMQTAWTEVLGRHPELCRFHVGDPAATPLAGPEAAPFACRFAPGASEAALEREIRSAAESLNRRLDCRTGPMLGADLFDLGDGRYELLTVVHHLAADGIAIETVLRDLLGRATTGRPVPRPDATFAAYCRQVQALAHSTAWSAAAGHYRSRPLRPFLVAAGPQPLAAGGAGELREIWPAANFQRFAAALYLALGQLAPGEIPVVSHRLHGRTLAGRNYTAVVGDFAVDVPIGLGLPPDPAPTETARAFRAEYESLPELPYALFVLAGDVPAAHAVTGVRLNFQPFASSGPAPGIEVIHRHISTYQPPDRPALYALDLVVRVDGPRALVLARFGPHLPETQVRRVLELWRRHLEPEEAVG